MIEDFVLSTLLKGDNVLPTRANKKWLDKIHPGKYNEIMALFPEYNSLKDKILAVKFGVKRCARCNAIMQPKRLSKYCSRECSKLSGTWREVAKLTSTPECRAKARETSLRKYGVENYSQSKEAKEKLKQKTLEKYGVEHYMQSEEFKAKSKASMLERYGVENALQSKEIMSKRNATMLERYGTIHALQNEDIKARTKLGFCDKETIDKIQKTMFERYGKPYALQVDSIREKTHQTCMNNHGVRYYMQSDNMRRQSFHTMTGSSDKLAYIRSLGFNVDAETAENIIIGNPGIFMPSREFIEKQINGTVSISDVKKEYSDPYPVLHKLGLMPDYSMSTGHKEISDWLNSIGIEHEINNRRIIKPLEIDIFIPSMNIGIEYNGSYWHSEKFRDSNYHERKMRLAASKGVMLIMIWDYEWDSNSEYIKSELLDLFE